MPLKCVQLFCLLLDEQIACFSENEQQAVQTTHTQVVELLSTHISAVEANVQ